MTAAWRRIAAQTRIELLLTLRRGESILLTFAIPMLLLGFFAKVDVLPKPHGVKEPVEFLLPGILALAVMSTAMVSLAIATGFERETGVLKRLGATPLRRRELLGAKTIAMLAIEAAQVVVLFVEGLLLGWSGHGADIGVAVAAMVVASVAFAGLGLLMAGALSALTTLAAANGLWLILLLVSGMVIPLSKLTGWLQGLARALPSGALADAVRGALSATGGVPGRAWLVLAIWAIAAPAVASMAFRWE